MRTRARVRPERSTHSLAEGDCSAIIRWGYRWRDGGGLTDAVAGYGRRRAMTLWLPAYLYGS